jgi:ubiquinone/menaquinone biosynthesis methyltransferase
MKDKATLVKNIFSSVANNYDLMNNVMSLGVHHLWKDKFIELLPDYSKSLLDVAGGTGDIASRYYKKAKARGLEPQITICDINPEMIKVGRDKLIDNNILYPIDFIVGDAQKLPFDDMSYDYYTISFGIRNVTDISLALSEAYRVIKPGGKFMCLEFSHPTNTCFAKIYDSYSNLIPFIGEVVAGNKEAYKYLVDSIRAFPKQETFASMMHDAGFVHVEYQNLTNGVVAIHCGYKI